MCPSTGDDNLSAFTSPLLVDLLDAAIKQVNRLDLEEDIYRQRYGGPQGSEPATLYFSICP